MRSTAAATRSPPGGPRPARSGRRAQTLRRKPDWPDTPSLLRVYVADADAAFDRAIAAGARVVTPLDPTAWGDRGGRVRDPLGNIWWVVQRVEDVPPEELAARLQEPL